MYDKALNKFKFMLNWIWNNTLLNIAVQLFIIFPIILMLISIIAYFTFIKTQDSIVAVNPIFKDTARIFCKGNVIYETNKENIYNITQAKRQENNKTIYTYYIKDDRDEIVLGCDIENSTGHIVNLFNRI